MDIYIYIHVYIYGYIYGKVWINIWIHMYIYIYILLNFPSGLGGFWEPPWAFTHVRRHWRLRKHCIVASRALCDTWTLLKHCTVGFVTTEAFENTVLSLRNALWHLNASKTPYCRLRRTLSCRFGSTLWHLKASKTLYCQLRAYWSFRKHVWIHLYVRSQWLS